jgi:hypothetical protein
MFERGAGDHQVEVTLASPPPLHLGPDYGVATGDRWRQHQQTDPFYERLDARQVLNTSSRLLRAEQQLGVYDEGDADVARIDISESPEDALFSVQEASDDIRRARTSRQAAHGPIRTLPLKQGIQLRSCLSLPTTKLAKDIRS